MIRNVTLILVIITIIIIKFLRCYMAVTSSTHEYELHTITLRDKVGRAEVSLG